MLGDERIVLDRMREFEKTFEQNYGRAMTDAEQHVSRQLERSFSRDWRLFPSRLYASSPETHPVFVLVFPLVTTAYSDTARHYFIQAQDVVWDFAPSGQNLVRGGPIPRSLDPKSHVWQGSLYRVHRR